MMDIEVIIVLIVIAMVEVIQAGSRIMTQIPSEFNVNAVFGR